jgi:hypothetical protein
MVDVELLFVVEGMDERDSRSHPEETSFELKACG